MSARVVLLLGPAAALLLTPAPSHAFCQATTCNPNSPDDACQFDENDCLITGKPLAWRSGCVTFGVNELGSASNGLSFEDVEDVATQAFDAWMNADCGGRSPSIEIHSIGSVECDISEYNQKRSNANIVVFIEDEWPHTGAGNAIGITTTRFDKETGDLWDGDIELNGTIGDFSIGDPVTGTDLLSVLTHETGHFLGLGHSPDQTATMKLMYDPAGDGTSFRTLAPDDESGICQIYPPGRKPATTSCVNRHGFSEQCGADQPPPGDEESKGCSATCAAAPRRVSWWGNALASLLLVSLLARAKSRRQGRALAR
ncbi:MAG TPA: matrixin family metalloprotease [Polyangiaceae bacterium]|nr:matrixin family metalloprotease [Polyangiaceae bacterium]